MCTKKEVLIFLAGAEAFHAFVHAGFWMVNAPEIHLPWFTVTQAYHPWAILVNAVISAGLLYWASKLK